MRKVLKIFHSLSASGLIGGIVAYMVLLGAAGQATPVAYAEMRAAIETLSNYLLLPSLAVVLVSGLLPIAVHRPFMDKGWVWLKAVSGLLMFKGGLAIVAKAGEVASVSQRVANGDASAATLDSAIANEWLLLVTVLAVAVANTVVGVWRPRLSRGAPHRSADRPETPAAGLSAASDG